jgi:hypothetical protein
MDQMYSAASTRNAEFPWDHFNTSSYLEHNYIQMRDDDAEILGLTQSWFAAAMTDADGAAGAAAAAGTHGLDVGCGPNLYPSLAMLPLCETLTLIDYSVRNVSWMSSRLGDCDEIWRPYWDLVSPAGHRGHFDEARSWLAARGRVRRGSVFDLPAEQWDLGTMFFVAESITADYAEFDLALAGFLSALRPGAPFAVAFMEQSVGYDVGGVFFPSVSVGVGEIDACLSQRTTELKVHRIETNPAPLRPGYSGMLLALGRTA